MYNMDEKGFQQGISDKAKVICVHRQRGMTGKMATDGTRKLITVVETISGDGVSLPPLQSNPSISIPSISITPLLA